MSRFFKSAAFPILIVVVLAFFAQRLINTGDSGPRYDYSTFQQDLSDGNVRSAVIKTRDNTLEVTLREPANKKHEIGYVPEDGDALVSQSRRRESPSTSRAESPTAGSRC